MLVFLEKLRVFEKGWGERSTCEIVLVREVVLRTPCPDLRSKLFYLSLRLCGTYVRANPIKHDTSIVIFYLPEEESQRQSIVEMTQTPYSVNRKSRSGRWGQKDERIRYKSGSI